MKEIRLSVHQIVDFLLRSGDIDNRVFNRNTMQEGTRLHLSYQNKQDDNYISEYPLLTREIVEDSQIVIEGRADGIIKYSDTEYSIDEIKTTNIDLDTFKNENEAWHLGQAKMYAYMFCKEQKLKSIGIRLTYIRQGDEKDKKIFDYSFSFFELDQFFHSLLEDYLEFFHMINKIKEERNEQINKLQFPYNGYREGQKDFMKYAFSISNKGGKLFVEAPTGIGKTISVLFPAIKTLVNDEQERIFYLTAKSSGKESAINALKAINKPEGNISYINLTSKDKICFCKNKNCNPDECLYAKGYYSKIQSILKYCLLNYREFDYDIIISLAKEYQICPFEFELDLSLFLDVIICDYNYVFDPISYLKRYFDEDSSHDVVLIDEAHNMISRSRDMYSESIFEEEYLLAKKTMRHSDLRKIKVNFTKIGKIFNELKKLYPSGYTVIDSLDSSYIKIFSRFIDLMMDANKNNYKEIKPELTDFYLRVNRFMKIFELVDTQYSIYINNNENKISINLFCKDASSFIKSISCRMKSNIFFSATLSPIDYYVDMLGGDKHLDPLLMLSSPFSKENFKLIVAPKVSIKYKNRDNTYLKVKEYIESFINVKVGNYIVYLPSYEYLNKILPLLDLKDIDLLIQKPVMDEVEREQFINSFRANPDKTTLGLAIMGGTFSEGIDLISDRLIGVVIVGIGMPKINFQSDLIKDYFNNKNENGYNYAYLYPGMNKVMQAIGRVIRDENDRGAALLIDERYTINEYRDLLSKEWPEYEIALNKEEVIDILSSFYENTK